MSTVPRNHARWLIATNVPTPTSFLKSNAAICTGPQTIPLVVTSFLRRSHRRQSHGMKVDRQDFIATRTQHGQRADIFAPRPHGYSGFQDDPLDRFAAVRTYSGCHSNAPNR